MVVLLLCFFFHTLIILQIIDIYVKMHYDGFGLAFESLENHVKETKKVRLKMGEASTLDLTSDIRYIRK